MKKSLVCFTLAVCYLVLMYSGTYAQDAFVQASDNASVYFVQGLPGFDLGWSANLPIDVYLDEELRIENMAYGKISGLVKIPPGSHKIQIYSAGTGPATMAFEPIIEKSLKFNKIENASVVVHLTKEGEATITKFSNDLSPVVNNKCRAIVYHCMMERELYLSFYNAVANLNYLPHVRTWVLENGDKFVCEISNKYKWWLCTAYEGSVTHPYDKPFIIKPRKAALVFLVGSKTMGTDRIIIRYTKKLK